jgi:hypothetical protein
MSEYFDYLRTYPAAALIVGSLLLLFAVFWGWAEARKRHNRFRDRSRKQLEALRKEHAAIQDRVHYLERQLLRHDYAFLDALKGQLPTDQEQDVMRDFLDLLERHPYDAERTIKSIGTITPFAAQLSPVSGVVSEARQAVRRVLLLALNGSQPLAGNNGAHAHVTNGRKRSEN